MYERIEVWRNEKITDQYPYVYLDGISLKRTWGGEVRNVAILVAVGVGQDGYRDILGVAEGCKEDKAGWSGFLAYLKRRGLTCPELFISDKCIGLIESLAEYYPEAKWQRCTVHWYRNVLSVIPRGRMKEVAAMLKAIHAQEDAGAAKIKAAAVAEKLETMKLYKAAEQVRQGIDETLSYHNFPREHHRHIYTNNPQENIMRQIRRRTRVVGAFPDGNSALMLAAARLRHIAGTQWGLKRYMNMERLTEFKREQSEKLTGVAG
jgi:transposase-like protein